MRTPTAQNVLLVPPVQGLSHFPLGQSWTLHSEPPTPSIEQQKNKRGWKPCVLTVGPHRPSNHKCDETAWKLATKLRLLGSLCQEEWRGSKHGVDPSSLWLWSDGPCQNRWFSYHQEHFLAILSGTPGLYKESEEEVSVYTASGDKWHMANGPMHFRAGHSWKNVLEELSTQTFIYYFLTIYVFKHHD